MVKIDVMHTTQVLVYKSSESYNTSLLLVGTSDAMQHHMCHSVCSADTRELLGVLAVVCLSFMLSHLVPSIKPRHKKVCQIAILNALRTTLKSVTR